MALLTLNHHGDALSFDEAQCQIAGLSLAETYRTAAPFPHIVIDDIIEKDVLRSMLIDFPSTQGKEFFNRDQERLKFQFAPRDIAQGPLRTFLGELNSASFISFLENMTGITGLIPDPYFEGGGLHETKAGGYLGIHADFNIHRRLRLERRLNLLIYLNDDWSPDFGGELELWDSDMTTCQSSVAPLMGRAVVFNTSLGSYHGHPKPLSCPSNRSRRSVATYYYTAPEAGIASLPKRTTVFKPRPHTSDRYDWSIAYQHFISDWVPPKLQALASRLVRS